MYGEATLSERSPSTRPPEAPVRPLSLAIPLGLLLFTPWDAPAEPGAALAQDRAPSPLAAERARLRPDTYDVPMADGVTLTTDVWLPRGRGPWPVLIKRTPYGRKLDNGEAEFAAEGYAVVVQDVRGRYGSEGEYDAFLSDGWGEHQDGRETVEWALSQPWASGEGCVTGASASGITSYLAVGALPEGLSCAFLEVATGDIYSIAVFQGGAFRAELVNGWLASLGESQLIDQIEEHPDYDDEWAGITRSERAAEVEVPIYQLAGWYDPFQQGNLNAFQQITAEAGPAVAAGSLLVIGPWTHGGWSKTTQGQVDFPANSTYSLGGDRDAFFARYLKGGPPVALPRVQYYVMGAEGEPASPGNEWRTADSWPPPSTATPFYLRRDGTLTQAAPGAAAPSTYAYDPQDPVPTRGGANLVESPGPYDQQDVEGRRDVLVFTTAPLSAPLTVVGRLSAQLWVASSALDTDFTVKLTDVYPDGRSMLVADGILRMRFREGIDHEVLMEPGAVYPIDVDLWSTAKVFPAGHSVRVAVSSSNSPRFEANPNTGEPFHQETARIVADQTVYHDAVRPSHITLPVVP